jgi:hypothetical protein
MQLFYFTLTECEYFFMKNSYKFLKRYVAWLQQSLRKVIQI